MIVTNYQTWLLSSAPRVPVVAMFVKLLHTWPPVSEVLVRDAQ
jgi:hypothetical protein